jgi:uncharacterized protein (TIGR02646 family)
MIQIRLVELPAQTDIALKTLQAQINSIPSHADRVKHARERFDRENRTGNEVFDVIRRTLGSMCAGACRCMYCEDSTGNEVEHFRPKSFYPEFAFIWLNYLYSCSSCNRTKRDHFRILCGSSGYVDLARSRIGVPTQPPEGISVLIDPRSEDPSYYLGLDLLDTFWFVPRHPKGSFEHARAQYTIDRLKLNDRDYLPLARQEAYDGYRARLREYVEVRGTVKADQYAQALSHCGHPTVWAEMKAQSLSLPELMPLFTAAPEVLGW